MMDSPYESKTLASIEREPDSEKRALLRLELACYLARVGHLERSENIRQQTRAEFGDGRNARVSIMIMLLEAIQHYYRDVSPLARDWLLRANLLSKAFQEKRLVALTSAWLALVELNRADFVSMGRCLEIGLSEMTPGDDLVEVRIALVLGDAFLLAGKSEQSQHWYERARLAATRLGDRAALGAMTYNRAALRLARCRFEALRPGKTRVDYPLLTLDFESAFNYQRIAQLRSLDYLLSIVRVGLLMVKEEYSGAIPTIEDLLASPELRLNIAQRTLLTADLSLCLASLGRLDEARRLMPVDIERLSVEVPSDDLAIALGSIRSAQRICDMPEEAITARRLQVSVANHERVSTELAGILEPLREFRAVDGTA